MAKNTTALAVIEERKMQCISQEGEEQIRGILESLADVDNLARRLMGRIKIGSGGMLAFSVMEPGAERPEVTDTLECVIIMSHKCNAYWARPLDQNDGNKLPDCASANGETGIRSATGEVHACKTCPLNQYDSDPKGGAGKACKNMRRLYVLREQDLFPMILALPPTALKAYDDYRVAQSVKFNRVEGLLTRITLMPRTSAGGTEYGVPIFEAAAKLTPADTARMRAYAAEISGAAQRNDITVDDYSTAPDSGGFKPVDDETPFDKPDSPPPVAEHAAQTSFMSVDEDELPPEA